MGKFKAPPIQAAVRVFVNGTDVELLSNNMPANFSWEAAQSNNTTVYTISNGKVVWSDGTILQYNETDVLSTDVVVQDGQYTTRANTLTIKAGTYVFKQTITNPTSTTSAVNFTEVKGYYLTANNTYVSTPEEIIDWALTPNGCQFSPGGKANNMNDWKTSFYDFDLGKLVTYTTNDTTLLRTIIVTADQTNVREAFYNWFMANIETTPSIKLIKIKFKDSITYGSLEEPLTISVSFTSNGTNFTSFEIDPLSSRLMYDSTVSYKTNGGYTNANYQYIEIDPTQANYNEFITAMKNNIAGVELEAGTYKWVDIPEFLTDYNATFNFNSNSVSYVKISLNAGKVTIDYVNTPTNYARCFVLDSWENVAYKTITTTENQYIDYDFYNYAILGNQLVKQGSTPTYSFKHWKKSNVVVNRTLVGEKYFYFKPYTILGLYTITTTLTNCTGASVNATKIQENGGLTLTFTANSGYELPTGVSVTNVTSYNWNKSTGVLAISKPTGDVTIEIVAVSALPQLSTPSNVAVTDTTLTFDEVENATSYEVFVDNVSIGTHNIVTGHTISWSGGGKTPSIRVSINDGKLIKLAEATGSINNVKTIKFFAEFNEFMVATVKSTTLNLNLSGDGKPSSITAGSIVSSEYTLTQDVTDLVISTAPRSTI